MINLYRRPYILTLLVGFVFLYSSSARSINFSWFSKRSIAVIVAGFVGLAGFSAWAWSKYKTTRSNSNKESTNNSSERNRNKQLQKSSRFTKCSIYNLLNELNQDLTIDQYDCKGRLLHFKNFSIGQIRVSNQFDSNGSGCASCGYHAIKNSIYSLSYVIDKLKNLPKFLNDFTLIEELVGKNGTWRKMVIKNRKMTLYKHYITSRIRTFFLPLDKIDCNNNHQLNLSRIRDLYLNQISIYCNKLVSNIFEGKLITINSNGFLNYLSQASIQINDKTKYLNGKNSSINLNNVITNPNFIQQFITKDVSDQVALSLDAKSLELVKKTYKKEHPKIPINLDGEWLDDAELLTILKSTGGKTDFTTIIGNVEDATQCDFMPEGKRLREVRDKLSSNDNFLHAFILGTMRRRIIKGTSTESTNSGHWYSLLVYKTQGRRYYLIADSVNQCRIYSREINTIMEVLEGKEQAKKIINSR